MARQQIKAPTLAQRSHLERGNVHRKITGTRTMSLPEFALMSGALGVSPAEMLTRVTAALAGARRHCPVPSAPSPQEVLDHEVACGECGSLDEAAAHLASLTGPGEDAPAGGDASPALAGPVREAA